MDIPLEKSFAVKLFCYCRQAARSVHRGLGGSWPALIEYYQGDRGASIQQLLQELTRLLAPDSLAQPRCSRQEIGRGLPAIGLFRVLLGRWLARRKTIWPFRREEIQFMASTLTSFLGTLQAPIKPEDDSLIALRMDLNTCEAVVEARCYGVPELTRAVYLEHFDQTDWLPIVRMSDILGEQRRTGSLTQRSA